MTLDSKLGVLATSAGNGGFPGVFFGLKQGGIEEIFACDSAGNIGGSGLAKKVYKVPPIFAKEELIKSIIDITKSEKINVVLPLSTIDQDFFFCI
jgi:hypothetical protein